MSYLTPVREGTVVMYAHLEETDREASRRGAPRRKLYLTADASQYGSTTRVEILNVSATGFLMRCESELKVDEPLTVILPGLDQFDAAIVWWGEDLFGCRFGSELSKADLSAIRLRAQPARDEVPGPALGGPAEESFGERLKRLRGASPYSMIEFAERIGVTKPTLWKWETDKVRPREKMVRRLAEELQVDEMALLYGEIGGAETGVRAAPAKQAAPQHLAELIADSRDAIADFAGVAPDKVSVAIDWD